MDLNYVALATAVFWLTLYYFMVKRKK